MQSALTPNMGVVPPRFRIDDLEVDIGKAEVTRGDEKIALPKLSFDLLLALINAAPSIVTNDDLLQQVWPGLLVSPESVAQRVKLLRSAIGDDSQQPRYILGVRGRGYRLIPVPERIAESGLLIGDAGNPSLNTPNATMSARSTSQTPQLKLSKHGRKPITIAAAVLIAIGVAVWVGWCSWSLNHTAQPATVAMVDRSIAVLPLVDMSEKKDQEYFADGMAEEIIDLLVKVPGLKVISRTSSFQFKGKNQDLQSIATQLGLAYVLQGSVRKSGDRLRVTAQLIDSKDGTHLWSQTYDRDLSDVLKMQDEIAIALVRALQIEVGAGFFSRPALHNTEAYTLYLQGLHARDRFDHEGTEQAIGDFERVIELDPAFAPAELWLGNAYFVLGLYGFVPPTIAFEKDRQASERALKLDPNSAIAHAQLAEIHRLYDWDWPAADRELKQALALAPGDGGILFYAAGQSLTMGRWDEAVKQVNAALAQDPLNQAAYWNLSLSQSRRGRLEEAEAAARRALEVAPTAPFAHYILGSALLDRSQPEAALMEFSKETVEGARLGGSAMAHFAMGRKADSDAALAQMIKSHADRGFLIARVYGFRDEADEALKWLERAYAQKDSTLSFVKGDPAFKKIEGNPRYKAFLKKLNLPSD
jgi:TolB-like protein/DNA-binding winged helix-turn-helix (wHTH) protein/Flp pilus assembly protein TadD